MSEMKNTVDKINRSDTVKEKITEPKAITPETIQSETHREKNG